MTKPSENVIRLAFAFPLAIGLLVGVSADEVIAGCIGGAIFGGLFGLFVYAVMRRKEREWAKLREPYEAEGIVHHGPAACAIGPGYMMLLPNRLVWLPIAERDRHKRIEIPYKAIKLARKAGGLGYDVHIAVSTGESVEFLTRDRNAWIDHITRVATQSASA